MFSNPLVVNKLESALRAAHALISTIGLLELCNWRTADKSVSKVWRAWDKAMLEALVRQRIKEDVYAKQG
jgi:hypothetical protein